MVGYISKSMMEHVEIVTCKAFGHGGLGPAMPYFATLAGHWRLVLRQNQLSKELDYFPPYLLDEVVISRCLRRLQLSRIDLFYL